MTDLLVEVTIWVRDFEKLRGRLPTTSERADWMLQKYLELQAALRDHDEKRRWPHITGKPV